MKRIRYALVTASAGTALALTACGAWQATKDGTVDAAKWAFTTQVKTMNVDLDARAALNETTGGQPLSTVVRLYQLKDSKTFAQLEYVQLQNNDLELLKADLVATKDVILRPGSSASVSESMDKDTQYVGVVAFFRQPSSNDVWKLLIPKKQWKDTDPVKVRVQSNSLAYEGANPKPVTRDAPQQSTPAKASAGMAASGAASGAASVTSAASTKADKAPVSAINPAAAFGEAADSTAYQAASVKAATQTARAATESLPSAKAGARASTRGATGLLAK